MRVILACLFCVGSVANSAYAGCDCPDARSVPVPQPQVATQPAPTVRQQHIVMVPSTQTVDVEQTITEYVPQTRTETVQQEIQVMVPEVREYVQEQVQQHSHSYFYQQSHLHQYGSVPDVDHGRARGLTDKQMALLYASRALADMEIDGKSKGEIRRAKRRVAWLQRRVHDSATRGGF